MRTDPSVDGSLASGWRWPTIQRGPALALLTLFVTVSLVQGSAVNAALYAAGARTSWRLQVLLNVTGAVAGWLAFPIVQTVVLNAASPRGGWGRQVRFHLAGYAVFAPVHAGVMLALQVLAVLVLGPRMAPRAPLWYRFVWEVQHDILVYAGFAAVWSLTTAWAARRAADLRAARLEARLASSRLEALTAQIDPHFLFNALNTVSAVMYEDLPRTERLLASLGELLRPVLSAGGPTWSLACERGHTERYVALLEARFGERLAVRWDVAPGLDAARVPRFALQTLVENAVKHNADRTAPLAVCVTLAGDAAALSLAVDDDGRGFAPGTGTGAGTGAPRGLARLEETLLLMFGAGGRLARGASPMGGARVELRIPRERADG